VQQFPRHVHGSAPAIASSITQSMCHARRIRTSPWYFAAVEYTRMYRVGPQAPKCLPVSRSLCPLAAALLVLLGRLHVPLLDVLPLSLPIALALLSITPWVLRTPLLRPFQIFSDPVSKALSPCLASSPSVSRSQSAITYSCIPKAAPKTVNNMVVLLRRTALHPMVSIVMELSWRLRKGRRTCTRCRASGQSG
jgi:hypothetical protein